MATETDKVNTGALATLVAVGTFATLSVALGVDALVRYETSELSAERASHASERYRGVVAEQAGKLSAKPGWSDQSKGLVSMPITQAMGHVVADLARDPLSASPLPPAPPKPEPVLDPDAGAPVEPGAAEATDGGAPLAPATSAVPPAPPASAATSVPAGKITPAVKAPSPTGAVSPKPSTVLAVPAAPPAAPPRAPAPAPPAPTDG